MVHQIYLKSVASARRLLKPNLSQTFHLSKFLKFVNLEKLDENPAKITPMRLQERLRPVLEDFVVFVLQKKGLGSYRNPPSIKKLEVDEEERRAIEEKVWKAVNL